MDYAIDIIIPFLISWVIVFAFVYVILMGKKDIPLKYIRLASLVISFIIVLVYTYPVLYMDSGDGNEDAAEVPDQADGK